MLSLSFLYKIQSLKASFNEKLTMCSARWVNIILCKCVDHTHQKGGYDPKLAEKC